MNVDVRLLPKTSPAQAFEQGTRQTERIEAEVAPGERIESGPLPDRVSTDPQLDCAGFRNVALDAWEQRFERFLTPREETVGVPRLRRPGSHNRALGQRVPVENNDLLKVGRDGLRRREASHPGADDDGLLG